LSSHGGINPGPPHPEAKRKAVMVKKIQAFSVVGSPEYMSPGVIKGRAAGDGIENGSRSGYGQEVDWWSLGCVFFECILGAPPFSGDSVDELFEAITNWEKVLPELLGQYKEDMSEACYSLLSGFLNDNENRLGPDVNKVKSHPFFAAITSWDNLDQLESPFVPVASSSDK